MIRSAQANTLRAEQREKRRVKRQLKKLRRKPKQLRFAYHQGFRPMPAYVGNRR